MAGLRAPWEVAMRARRRGKGGDRCRGHGCGDEEGREGRQGLLLGELGGCYSVRSVLLYLRKKEEREERKEMKKGRGKKRNGKKFWKK
jgi:hypothetical protein